MTILKPSSWAAAALLMVAALLPVRAPAAIVALDIDLPLDQIAPGRPFKPGDHHRARVFYDDSSIDPATHRVAVLHMQHLLGAAGWQPARLDATAMPMTAERISIAQRYCDARRPTFCMTWMWRSIRSRRASPPRWAITIACASSMTIRSSIRRLNTRR